MPKTTRRRAPCVDHLTPDRVLDIAYCYHVASDAAVEASPIGALAKRVVGDFELLCAEAPRTSPEWRLLFSLEQIVVSLSKGITRRKATFEQRLRVAEQEKEQSIQSIAADARRSGLLKAVTRSALMGGFGYALMALAIPGLRIGEKMQASTASLAAAIAFILLTSFAKSWLMNRRVKSIFELHERAQFLGYREYQEGALDEYLRAKRDACHAWERYAGAPAEEWPGFETVILDDLRTHKSLQDEREALAESPLAKAAQAVKKWRRRKALASRLSAARESELAVKATAALAEAES